MRSAGYGGRARYVRANRALKSKHWNDCYNLFMEQVIAGKNVHRNLCCMTTETLRGMCDIAMLDHEGLKSWERVRLLSLHFQNKAGEYYASRRRKRN